MKKSFLMLCVAAALVMGSGCSYFVPGSIKREVSLVKVDLETAVKEVESLQGDEAKQKALRTFKRVIPHVDNLNNYMQGKKATR